MSEATSVTWRSRWPRHALARASSLLLGLTAGLVLAILQPPGDANAHSYKLDDIAVGHFWAPPPEEGAAGVPVYGPILNQGDSTVRLVGASSPIAKDVRFRVEKDDGVSWPEAVELRPDKPLGLAAWREHIWLSGLKRPLKDGDDFELTLDFGDSGQLTVKVVVEKAAGH
jgi:copper(I)-binding protein